ncbi:MAG: phytanoyl-CoA dioxygenase family protein [Pseudomonadales bacterium]
MHTVTAEEVVQFRRAGYMRIPRLIDDQALGELRAAYDTLIADGASNPGTRDALLGGLTRQIVRPELSHPLFRDNAALQAGRAIARELRGWDEPAFFYSQLLFKPPGHPHATPWHQDDAYGVKPFAAAGIRLSHQTLQFWLALDPADVDNGCMHFHPPVGEDCLLPHRVAAGDPEDDARLLGLESEAEIIEPALIVACPLAAGGVTVHDSGTLHYTPANRSDRPRRAYIFNFANPAFLASLT